MQTIKPSIIFITVFLFLTTQVILPITMTVKNNNNLIYKINTIKENPETKKVWEIEIPKIELKAQISDGIDSMNLNKYVGHFPQSGYISGNICLAAHNRGYNVNYFANIKELQKGDKIIYRYNNIKLTYIVNQIKTIKDTNIEVIENTKENQITLITCVENQPELRRCIQGKLANCSHC